LNRINATNFARELIDKTPREVELMDKDRVKGTVNDAAGRVKRQVGEWTGDTNAQLEGSAQQVKGKVQKAWGSAKDAARDVSEEARRERESERESETVIEDEEVSEREHSSHSS
jgi:uncharacterized protein YjbJ (UPF0337 family)